jgi:hypothetical protein
VRLRAPRPDFPEELHTGRIPAWLVALAARMRAGQNTALVAIASTAVGDGQFGNACSISTNQYRRAHHGQSYAQASQTETVSVLTVTQYVHGESLALCEPVARGVEGVKPTRAMLGMTDAAVSYGVGVKPL